MQINVGVYIGSRQKNNSLQSSNIFFARKKNCLERRESHFTEENYIYQHLKRIYLDLDLDIRFLSVYEEMLHASFFF